jgi:hypothetical protein
VNKDASRVQHQRTYVCENLLGSLGCMVLLITLSACVKRKTLPNDELFRRVQEHEARIAVGEAEVRAADHCKEAHEPAERGVCDESKALCKLTVRSQELDAVRRCVIASDTCRAARERAQALCATPAQP